MALRARLVILSRRFQSVLVAVALVRMHVSGYEDLNDRIGVHRRFGHSHHAWLKRRHNKQNEGERGPKPHHTHKSRMTRGYHGISFDTCSGVKSSCTLEELAAKTET